MFYANEVKKVRCEHHGCFNRVWILCLRSKKRALANQLYLHANRISFPFAVYSILIQNEKCTCIVRLVQIKMPAVKVCECIFFIRKSEPTNQQRKHRFVPYTAVLQGECIYAVVCTMAQNLFICIPFALHD